MNISVVTQPRFTLSWRMIFTLIVLVAILAGIVLPLYPAQAQTGLKVQYRASDTNAGDNQMKPHFNVVNSSASSVNLSGLKVRYYFNENTTQAFTTYCDYAAPGAGSCSNVTRTIVLVSGADRYIEIGFTSGTLAAGASTGEIQIRFNKNDWSNFNESDDYSFDPTKTSFADWSKVTLHNSGTLVWGTPPGGATNTPTGPTATRTATRTNTPLGPTRTPTR